METTYAQITNRITCLKRGRKRVPFPLTGKHVQWVSRAGMPASSPKSEKYWNSFQSGEIVQRLPSTRTCFKAREKT